MAVTSNSLASFFTPGAEIVANDPPRIAMSLEALEKCGKTHYSLYTPPDPICLITNDTGTVRVLKKALASGRRIDCLQQSFLLPDPKKIKREDVDKAEAAAWKKEWVRFEDACSAIVEDTSKKHRTLVIDNGSELANLCELAHFGKLRGNARIDIRAEYNAAFSRVFWNLYKGRPDLNMIWIHRLKKEYKPNSKGNDSWTGKYERKGFTDMGFMVDFSLRAGWDPIMKDFYTELDGNSPTRFGADLIGNKWYSKEGQSSFSELGLSIFPDTELTPEVWGL